VSDWLAGIDDGLTQRLRFCTLCGKRQVGFWGIAEVESTGLHIAYVLCETCQRTDKERRQVEALLAQRYGRVDDSQ
jgi:hypothetical protein